MYYGVTKDGQAFYRIGLSKEKFVFAWRYF